MRSEPNSRIASLDGLRGLAALAIVILHYRNLNDKWNESIINTNPFWDQVAIVYKFGWIGVEFFFVLSGFIFFWRYGELISNKAITLTDFAVLRLTRLYPLHIATLLLTALCQYLVFAKSNATFIYGNHDVYHFLLHLSFLNYGWIEVGHSFNAPAWSIALEMGLYFLFYAVCFGRRNRALIALGLMLLFLQVNVRGPIPNVPLLNEPFTRVGYCFFLGGLLHFLYTKVERAGKVTQYVGAAAFAGAMLMLAAIQFASHGNTAVIHMLGPRIQQDITLGLFPMLIAAALLFKPLKVFLGARLLTSLGDISYSMYLIHFPLQVAIHYYTLVAGPVDFQRKPVFLTYVALTLGIAYFSHHYFERPVMKALRVRLISKRTAMPAPKAVKEAEVRATA